MSKFEECLLNDNLSALTISGFPSKEDLNKSWNIILTEYSEALGTSEYKLYINMYRQVEDIRIRYEMVNIAINTLRRYYSEYFAKEVNDMLRTKFIFDPENAEEYLEMLDRCERRSKSMKISLDLKQIQFEAIEKKMKIKGNKIDKFYFNSMLITLSRGLQLCYGLTKDITVAMYCEYFRQLVMMQELVKKR